MALSFFFVFAVGSLGQPHIAHKYYMLKDLRRLRWYPLLMTVSMLLAQLLFVGVGIAMKALVLRGERRAPRARRRRDSALPPRAGARLRLGARLRRRRGGDHEHGELVPEHRGRGAHARPARARSAARSTHQLRRGTALDGGDQRRGGGARAAARACSSPSSGSSATGSSRPRSCPRSRSGSTGRAPRARARSRPSAWGSCSRWRSRRSSGSSGSRIPQRRDRLRADARALAAHLPLVVSRLTRRTGRRDSSMRDVRLVMER